MVPSQRDGQLQGYRLYGMREGSVMGQLQFRNHDLITAVDGVPLTACGRGPKVVDALRRELETETSPRSIEVEVRRNDVMKTLVLTIGR